jgi:hypothetical protein
LCCQQLTLVYLATTPGLGASTATYYVAREREKPHVRPRGKRVTDCESTGRVKAVPSIKPSSRKARGTRTRPGYAIFFVPMHAIAVVAGPLTFTWEALGVAAALYVVTGGLGLSMSYHRQLSHKSFRCPKWLEFMLAYCGALAFEGDPIEWSKNHNWCESYD